MLKYLTIIDWVFVAFFSLAVLAGSTGCGGSFSAAGDPPPYLPPYVPAEPLQQSDGELPLLEGATISSHWGIQRNVIPNDSFHSWVFDQPFEWSVEERQVLLETTGALQNEVSWIVSFDAELQPATDVVVFLNAEPATDACKNGSTQDNPCWFANTGCTEIEAYLGDYAVCHRFALQIQMTNIHAFAKRTQTTLQNVLGATWRHEFGHSMGFMHEDAIMSKGIPFGILAGRETPEYTDCQKARLRAYTRFVGVDAQVTLVTPEECQVASE